MRSTHRVWVAGICLLASGCNSLNAYTNKPYVEVPTDSIPGVGRASLAITGARGNPDVLMVIAISGGGSRAAYFSAAVMLKLQKIFPDRDLLREVDVLSSVSGGSMTAAYYAVSKDARIDDAQLALAVAPPPPGDPVAPTKLHREGDAGLSCSGRLEDAERLKLTERVDDYHKRMIEGLCLQAGVASNRVWDEKTVDDLMTHDYVWRWIGNWFWPTNLARYWFTAFDRSDLMAQTFADNLYDVAVTGRDLTFADLNPERPFLIINSTNSTGDYRSGPNGDGFPFGSVFTFTTQDFHDRIASDLATYPVSRAVMASASFPVVFPSMTLRDFREQSDDRHRYVHVFDGGNSDNLGLSTVKRALLEAEIAKRLPYQRMIVISIDAFTNPIGAPSTKADSRGGWFDYLLDTNLTSAIDSLLQANRQNTLREFRSRILTWREKECGDLRTYPTPLCDALKKSAAGDLDLRDRLVFYHIGFDDVGDAQIEDFDDEGNVAKRGLRDRLDRIPTTLKLTGPDRRAIDAAVEQIVNERNGCLRAIRDMVSERGAAATWAQAACHHEEPELKVRPTAIVQ